MDPLEMRALLRREPFEPFRVHLRDGRAFVIRHPHLNLVTRQRFLIGHPDAQSDGQWAGDGTYVSWEDILRVEPLPGPTSDAHLVIRPEEMRDRLRATPFRPFRVRRRDGRTYDIRSPYLNLVTREHFVVGRPAPESGGAWAEGVDEFPWEEIQAVEPLPDPGMPA